jgi:hypothetical protein
MGSIVLREVGDKERTDEEWLRNVKGAKVLEDIFEEFSGPGFYYDKIKHGVAFTEWLIENAPEDLAEVSQLIEQALSTESVQ